VRFNWILIFILLCPICINAQDIPDKLPNTSTKSIEGKLELKEIVKTQNPLSKRIFFIIDVSGSMSEQGKIKKALQFVRCIWQAPFDEFEIAIVVFNDKTTRWEGIPSSKDDPKPIPKGWAKMPSKEAVDAAQKFLDQYPGSGGTYPMASLEMVLTEERSDLSVVLVTDGDYSESTSAVLKKITELQEAREKKGLGKAVISVFGVGEAEKEENLKIIGKDWLGGFYVEKPKKEEKKQSSPNSTSPSPSTITPSPSTPSPSTTTPSPSTTTPSPPNSTDPQ